MSVWKKARKKPIVVEYREVEPNFPSMLLMNDAVVRTNRFTFRDEKDLDCERVETLEGILIAFPKQHYIIRGVKGEIYPIKKEIFYETYEVIK